MALSLEKRSLEILPFDIVCLGLLGPTETITAITGISADTNAGAALTFGTPVINGSVIPYPDGTSGPIGTVITVLIGGGSVPAGLPYLDYVIRVVFTSTVSSAVHEATVNLRIKDTP